MLVRVLKYQRRYNNNWKRYLSNNVMNAAVLRYASQNGANDFKINIEKLKIPIPKRDEALIKVNSVGLCGTDLHVAKGEVPFNVPAVLGHEISGTIIQIGDHSNNLLTENLSEGMKVVSPFIMPCCFCNYCTSGEEDLCEVFFKYNRGMGTLYDGTTRLYTADKNEAISMYSMGGLAEYCVVPLSAVFELPSNVPFKESAILGCAMFTAYGAIKNVAKIETNNSIVVFGCGGVGSNILQLAAFYGAYPIIAVDIDDDKLQAATELGATHLINAKKMNVEESVRNIVPNGTDIAIEALGNPITFKQAVYSVRDGGKAVMVGIAPVTELAKDIEITHLVRRKIQILGSYGARARTDMPQILKLADQNKINFKNVTKVYKLNDVEQAFRDLSAGKITGRAIVDMNLS